MREPKCRNCLYFKPSGRIPLFGNCHTHPPAAKYKLDVNILGKTWISLDMTPQTEFPVVNVDAHCGRYIPQ